MDKNKLIAVLAYKLEGNGIEREGAITEAKSFVNSLSDEDAAKLTAMSGNDAMMSKIAASLKKKAETSHIQTAPQEVQEIVPSREPAAKANAPETAAPSVAREAPVKEYGTASQKDATPSPKPAQPRPGTVSRARQLPQRAKISRPPSKPTSEEQQRPPSQAQSERRTEKSEKKLISRPDPNADYKKFYIILACTSPIWLLLILAVVTLFLAVIGVFAVSIVVIIAALVAAVAAGTTLSVVGVVYGITQLFKYAPIGLYEIGLGLKIGGYLMLGGIIAYNIAVRLLPFLIKKILELFVFTAHKCVELYFYVKGACANL